MKFKVHYSSWIFKLPLVKSYAGIVLGRHIFFVYPPETVPKTLLWHELIHQKQMDETGVIGFYIVYFYNYVLNIFRFRFNHDKAYRNIPFEVEAYANQDKGNPYERAFTGS